MASELKNPEFVLVGGVSHTPIFWDALVEELGNRGYNALAVDYPTVGSSTEGTTQDDEVKAIKKVITDIVNSKHRDVILVCHSYGGWPGSRAVKGLDKATRQDAGDGNGIVEVVFIAGFLLPEDAPMAQWSYLPDWLTVEGDMASGQRKPNEKAMSLFFNDIDAKARNLWLSRCDWHRNAFTASTIGDAPWHISVPKTYVVTTDDKAATIQFQLGMLQGVVDSTWCIKSINAGHEPMVSQPERLAELLLAPRH